MAHWERPEVQPPSQAKSHGERRLREPALFISPGKIEPKTALRANARERPSPITRPVGGRQGVGAEKSATTFPQLQGAREPMLKESSRHLEKRRNVQLRPMFQLKADILSELRRKGRAEQRILDMLPSRPERNSQLAEILDQISASTWDT